MESLETDMARPSKKQAVVYPTAEPIPDAEESDDLDLTVEPEDHHEQGQEHDAQLLPALPAGLDGTTLPATVAPVTTLQQYLAEVRRYPYLSKEEELRLFHEYQTQGSREAAVQ
jgi:RNA polymerase sigma-32 factor